MKVIPTFEQFETTAHQAARHVLYAEISADLETPVSAYLKVAGSRAPAFLLESVEQGDRLGRYSYIGCEPEEVLRFGPETNPYQALKLLMQASIQASGPDLPPFAGGAVGYWGFETVRHLEPAVGEAPPDDMGLPEAAFLLTRSLIAFDHAKRTMRVMTIVRPDGDPARAYQEGCDRIHAWIERLRAPLVADPLQLAEHPEPLVPDSTLTREGYCAMVEKAKEHIKAGDIFQLVGSQRLSAPYSGEPFALYRTLRTVNPSPYMFFLDWGDFQLVGSSPEVMVRLDGRTATVRPIAGTRRRGLDSDEALGKDLMADPKERAEHVMLVDLGRNDLGRVCKPGSVKVDDLMALERFSHVLHMTSTVTGEMQDGLDGLDLLAACFPAGTVSGAPKVRAMQLINQLEPFKRGPYAGAVGVLGYDGSINTGITIRTMVVRDGRVHVQAGAGIVADSIPENEYQETLNKAQAMLQALQLAPIPST
ncbi:anthranilate synthase component I [bacterium]|nr:anthranilate synthase component I [bacterium]